MFFSLPQFSREPHPHTFLNADPTILFPNLGSKASWLQFLSLLTFAGQPSNIFIVGYQPLSNLGYFNTGIESNFNVFSELGF